MSSKEHKLKCEMLSPALRVVCSITHLMRLSHNISPALNIDAWLYPSLQLAYTVSPALKVRCALIDDYTLGYEEYICSDGREYMTSDGEILHVRTWEEF